MHNLCCKDKQRRSLSLLTFWTCSLTAFQTNKIKNEKRETEEQKAWRLIRTVTGIVAKLISQKEIGLRSISFCSREANLPGTPQGEQPGTGGLTLTAMSRFKWNLETNEVSSFFPQSVCQGASFSWLQSFTIQFWSRLLQVWLERDHMEKQHAAALPQEQLNYG